MSARNEVSGVSIKVAGFPFPHAAGGIRAYLLFCRFLYVLITYYMQPGLGIENCGSRWRKGRRGPFRQSSKRATGSNELEQDGGAGAQEVRETAPAAL